MAIKKYTLALALLGLVQAKSFAQTLNDPSDSYVFDSSKVAPKNMQQYGEFQKNAYPYPAMPKSQLELGGSVGVGFILGDHPPLAAKYTGGITGSITIRKAIGHVFSIRAGYSGSMISIPHYNHFQDNDGQGAIVTYQAAKNETHMGTLEAIASLNTISHYRGNPKTNIYVTGGYALVATRVRKFVGNNTYATSYFPQRNLIFTFGSAEHNNRKAWGVFHAASFGGGMAIKLSEKFNLAGEQKFIVPLFSNDFLDAANYGKTGDIYSYTSLRLNMNIGNLSTHVAPLWWINPNNYVYNEINHPTHLKWPPIILPDADGDGVTDQFDLEPNTPSGAAVDSHGRAKDTDGDGVPDYKDKEILTQQSCFPVNADGVGTCPEPACCKELRDRVKAIEDGGYGKKTNCAISSLPSVTFKSGSARLSKDAMGILTGAASQLNANPGCNVKVIGYAEANKRSQQLSWDRVNAVIKFLVEKQGVSEGRIIFSYDNNGASNTVDLQPTTDSGPNTVAPPAPQYRTTH